MAKKIRGMFVESTANYIEKEKMLKNKAKRLKATNDERVNKDVMLAKGLEFVENGIPFEMAPEELRNQYFFKIGYDIGIRRQKINSIEKVSKVKK